ncbi:MAG: DHA2 family efflux MFS transporter permease subunit, partial [Amphiplicatus sp.]
MKGAGIAEDAPNGGAPAPADETGPPETLDKRRLAVFSIMVIGLFFCMLDTQIVAASIPKIQTSLAASADEVSWLQTSYLIAEVIIIPITGYLIRALSSRVVFALAMAGFTLASLGCAMAWNLQSLVIMRAFQGIASGLPIPIIYAIAFSAFPRRHQGPMAAAMGLIVTMAPTVGPTLGGAITEQYSWHWLFLINVIPGAVITAVVWLYADFDKADHGLLKRFDLTAFALLGLALGLGQYVLEEGPDNDWFASPSIALMSAVALCCFAWFLSRTLSAREPIVDLRALQNRNFLLGNIMGLAMGAMFYGLTFILPLFLGRVRGYSAMEIGATLAVSGAAMFVAAPFSGLSSRRFDPRIVAGAGFLLLGWSAYALTKITAEWDFWELFWPQVARGVGLMFAMQTISVTAMGSLTPAQVKSASGVFNLTRMLGAAISLAALNTVLTDRTAFHARMLLDRLEWGRVPAIETLGALAGAFEAGGAADPDRAPKKAMGLIVQREAAVLAIGD